MGDFGHGMYGGAQEIASAPASVMHLPPIDPTSSLSRHNSYFSMAGSPAGSFDQMSAAAVAAAAAAAASAGPYSPHAAGSGQYMAAARGQQPYPSTMMIGRFNMGGMPSNSTPGAAIPTPPPPSSSVQSQHHQPPPLGSSNGTSMSVPTTPTRPIGMSRMNSHAQSSTTQRKRYLCTVCQKMFARPSTLSTHMHSHTGEKPFECTWDGCGKRFSVMSNLRRHQRIHERQRQKYAKAQQQQHGQMQPADVSDNDSSSGSTTPLVSQMLHSSIATPTSQMHGHHHRHQQHHMPPPPQGFSQPPMLASHVQGGISASLDMHHHGLPSLHHPHPQQHHQHHLMSSVASPPPQHYHHHVLHHPHQQPQQISLSDPLAKHSVISNSTSEDSATAVMSVKDESLSVANGASTASTNTINPTTPQSSGLKD
ncbi:hypothetical protein GGF42_002574 [Coemansia sp. RSA 2424]|nr:hypothetical protein GGF42_002574 [Coemansia sp. RSA 2424]